MSFPLTTKLKPMYTTFDSVKVRLANKIQFQTSPTQLLDGEMPDALLAQCIVDAETKVEQYLRGRYLIPLQASSTGRYIDLPDHSQRILRTLMDARAVMEVLRTDFGRGTHIDASKYYDDLKKEYTEIITLVLGRDPEGKNDKIDRFRRTPPLEGLALAVSNSEADDGYHGMIINTDADTHGAESYAAKQINNPSRTYIRKGRL